MYLLQPVEGARVVAQDLLLNAGRDIGSVFEHLDCVNVAGRIGMTIIGADYEAVLASFTDDIRNIIRIFAGDIHAIFTHPVLRPFAAEGFETVPRFMHHPRNPLSAGFDETKA